MTTTCTYLQQLTQVSDVAHGPLVFLMNYRSTSYCNLHISVKCHIGTPIFYCFITPMTAPGPFDFGRNFQLGQANDIAAEI